MACRGLGNCDVAGCGSCFNARKLMRQDQRRAKRPQPVEEPLKCLSIPGTFGELLKKLRIQKGISLRDASRKCAMDSGNWSKMETGMLPPPKYGADIGDIATILGFSVPDTKMLILFARQWHMERLEARFKV